MNMEEINFAYKVRHALNQNLESLPASTTNRLAAARQAALARKKADAPISVRTSALATAQGMAGGGGQGGLEAAAMARVPLAGTSWIPGHGQGLG